MDITHLKIAALECRQEIERIAAELWAPVVGCAAHDVWHTQVEARLMLVVGELPDGRRHDGYLAARKVGHVYRETSDVIHGRLSASQLTSKRAEEWRSDIDRLSTLWLQATHHAPGENGPG